jgi:hypothetical protein
MSPIIRGDKIMNNKKVSPEKILDKALSASALVLAVKK